MHLILASTSPRRRELLSLLKLPFTTLSTDIDESMRAGELPTDYILRMVADKAMASINLLADISEPTLILTADTIGVLANGKDILVKPTDKQDAFAMWQQMSGTHHEVWTAVQATLLNAKGEQVSSKQILEVTKVYFTELSHDEMASYWQTGEPADKAGGYAIQGLAGAWVERIEGSYTNVVGLPLAQVKQLIADIEKMSQE